MMQSTGTPSSSLVTENLTRLVTVNILSYVSSTVVSPRKTSGEGKKLTAQRQTSNPAAAPTRSDHNEQIVISIKSTLPVKVERFQMAFTFNLWFSDAAPERDFRGFRQGARGLRFWREQRGVAGSYKPDNECLCSLRVEHCWGQPCSNLLPTRP